MSDNLTREEWKAKLDQDAETARRILADLWAMMDRQPRTWTRQEALSLMALFRDETQDWDIPYREPLDLPLPGAVA